MDVYGLTGGIGSGKSAVAGLLQRYGIPVVSADELSRVVVAPGSDGLGDVVAAFGEEVLNSSGQLDRGKMASIVFQDPERRKKLEAILHPRIRERYAQVLEALEGAGHEVVVYEVPLLFEKDLQGEMKGVVLVTASERTRIARVMHRDGVTESQVRGRMKAQMPEDQKRRKADYIVENDGDLDDLRREVEFLLDRYLRVDQGRSRPVTDHALGPAPAGAPAEVPREDSSPIRDIAPQSAVVTQMPEDTRRALGGDHPAAPKRQGSSTSGEVSGPPSSIPTEKGVPSPVPASGSVPPPPPPAKKASASKPPKPAPSPRSAPKPAVPPPPASGPKLPPPPGTKGSGS